MFKKGGVKQFLNTAAVKESSSDGRQDFCFLYFLFVARFYLNVFVISASSPFPQISFLLSELRTYRVFFFLLYFSRGNELLQPTLSWPIFTLFVPSAARISGFVLKAAAQVEQEYYRSTTHVPWDWPFSSTCIFPPCECRDAHIWIHY